MRPVLRIPGPLPWLQSLMGSNPPPGSAPRGTAGDGKWRGPGEVPGSERGLVMVVQIVISPLHNVGFTLTALDSEGQILIGEHDECVKAAGY